MEFFYHYQEKTKNDDIKLLTDVVLTQESLEKLYDEYQIEHLFNSVGKWTENGVTYIKDGIVCKYPWEQNATEHALYTRIKRIISNGNLQDYLIDNNLPIE